MAAIQSKSDSDLVLQAQASISTDMRAFDTLVNRYRQKVLANCRYITKSADDSEDLAQEVFVKAFFGLRNFEGRSEFRTWLNRIKVNHCLNFIKKNKGKSFEELDAEHLSGHPDLKTDVTPDRGVANMEKRERIAAVLEEMPDTLRIPLLMRDLDGLAYEDIASTLGIGLSALKMRIKRGREEFRARYSAPVPEGAGS